MDDLAKSADAPWTNYVRGVAKYCREAGFDLAGFDGLVRKPIQPLEMYAAIAAATQWPGAEEEGMAHAAH